MQKDPRRSALQILIRADKKRKTLDALMEELNPCFERRDMALFHALVYGVLRWRARLDWFIKNFSKIPTKKINPEILNILRMGIFQIVFMNRIPDSAAVNTSVNLAKKHAPSWVAGYVNGVLRNCAKNHKNITLPPYDKNPLFALSVRKSFPQWLVKRWVEKYGFERTKKILDFINTIPPITLRANSLKITPEKLAEKLAEYAGKIKLSSISPLGVLMSGLKTSIGSMDAFKQGLFQVQDEAAQLIGFAADPKPGEKILDACAGLGGKTGHMAQLMENKGYILAIDNNEKKLFTLKGEMKRLGISIVKTSYHDLCLMPDIKKYGLFDKVLVDAPCSAMGVLRRNPDIKWSRKEKDLIRCQKRQIKFLNNLAHMVKPGGRLIYAVCSLEKEENEIVALKFLEKNPGFRPEKPDTGTHEKILKKIVEKNYLKTSYDIHNTDGFFTACFRRRKTSEKQS